MNGAMSREAMEKAKSTFPPKTPETTPSNGNGRRVDVAEYLAHCGKEIVKTIQHGTATLYCLKTCVFDQSHTGNEAAIGQDEQGKLFYQCFHDSCKSDPSRTWQAARKILSRNESLARYMGGGTSSEISDGTAGHGTGADVSSPLSEQTRMTPAKVLESAVMDMASFLKADIPEQPYIVRPILRAGSIVLLYAARGVGKTWLALLLMLAITRKLVIGSWVTEKTTGAMYVDSEMAAYDTQTRYRDLSSPLPAPEAYEFILSSDWALKNGLPAPNIVDREWREAIYDFMVKYHSAIGVLILDNLSSLTPGAGENETLDWDPINQWLLRLRALDVCVIMVHHAGKSGDQRGTSKREDNIDVTLKLTVPAGYQPEDGAKFNIELTKARGVYGEDAAAFSLQIIPCEGGLTWTTESTRKSLKDVIIAMFGKGIPQKDIPEILGKAKSYVSKVKARAIEDGMLTEKGIFTEKGEMEYGDVDIEKFTK